MVIRLQKLTAGLAFRVSLAHGRRLKSTTSPSRDPSKVRNIALVAHIDSGKTTLTESILLSSSYISSPGSVDTGSTTTDFLPAERERGITIQSASIPVHWKDWIFNLIDTPGHADFGMEVESAGRVIDGAVVLIDSVEGVEAQTKGVWMQLDRHNVATRMIFLNKLDRPGASFRSSLLSLLSHRFHSKPMVLSLPIASFNPQDYHRAEPGIHGLVDLVKWELLRWHADGQFTRTPLPRDVDELAQTTDLPQTHPLVPLLVPARTALLDNLSMHSEELMDILLNLPPGPSSYLSIDSSVVIPHLRRACLRNDVMPILCGSAAKHVGTELVMDYVGELLPSPCDVHRDPQIVNSPLLMLAWKVSWDSRRGWMTFVRVYSGTLTKQTAILNTNQKQRERVSKLLLLYASEVVEVDTLPFGSIGIILGLKHTRTGDTLVSAYKSTVNSKPLASIVPPLPVMSASIIPQSQSDLRPVQDALQSLVRTDPSVRVDVQDDQILIHGLGALHLEIVEGRLREEWDVRFQVGKRRVSYREGLGPEKSASTPDTYSQVIAGTTLAARVDLELRSLLEGETSDPAWDGNVVVDAHGRPMLCTDLYEPNDIRGQVARGIANTLSNSPHTSLHISRVHIQVKHFSCLTPETTSAFLAEASASILRDALLGAGIGPVMEPYIRMKISVPEDSLGRVLKDLTESGGQVLALTAEGDFTDGAAGIGGYPEDGVYVPPDWVSPSASLSMDASSPRARQTIQALAPLGGMLDYSSRLRALSGGYGVFETTNVGFTEVSESRKKEILSEISQVQA